MTRANRGALVWGIILILLGLVFLLQNFNIIPAQILDWWPLLALGAGIWLLSQAIARRRGGGIVGGVLLVTLGAFWLLANFGRVDEGLFAPVALIAVGVGLLLRTLMKA